MSLGFGIRTTIRLTILSPGTADTRNSSWKDLSSPDSWTVCSHPDYPGLMVVKGALSPDGLNSLLSRVLLDYPAGCGPDQDNLEDHVRFYYLIHFEVFFALVLYD